MDTMCHDQARMGLRIVSSSEADEEVVSPRGFGRDDARGVEHVGSADISGLGGKLHVPTFHSRSKQLRRSQRHWWQTAKRRDAYCAAVNMSCDVGQPEQAGHASQSEANMKQGPGWPRIFKPAAKDPKAGKVAIQATGAVLGLRAPLDSKVTSYESNGQEDAAVLCSSTLAPNVLIAADSSFQQLVAANSQTVAATAAPADVVPILEDGVYASIGNAAAESQPLQHVECSWQQPHQDELGSGAMANGASVQAIQDTSNCHHEQQPGTEPGKTR